MVLYFYCVYLGCLLFGTILLLLACLGLAALTPRVLDSFQETEKQKFTDRLRILLEVVLLF